MFFLLCCNYSPSFEDFTILTKESCDFNLKIMERLIIARDKLVLNKADSSFPLELFCNNISGYHMMFYRIIWCPSIPLCVYNLPFLQFSILCYELCILSKTECCLLYFYRFHYLNESLLYIKKKIVLIVLRKMCKDIIFILDLLNQIF